MAQRAGVKFPNLPPRLQQQIDAGTMDEATARQRALANAPQYRAEMGLGAPGADASPDAVRMMADAVRGRQSNRVQGGEPIYPPGAAPPRRTPPKGPGIASTTGGGFMAGGGDLGEGQAVDPIPDGMHGLGGPDVRDGGGFVRSAVPGAMPRGPAMGPRPGGMASIPAADAVAKPGPRLDDLAELAAGAPRARMTGGGLQGPPANPAPAAQPKPQLSDLASVTGGGLQADPAAENRRRLRMQRETSGAALGAKGY